MSFWVSGSRIAAQRVEDLLLGGHMSGLYSQAGAVSGESCSGDGEVGLDCATSLKRRRVIGATSLQTSQASNPANA